MGRKVEIELAYEDDIPLVLDETSRGGSPSSAMIVSLEWLAQEVQEEELPRILASAVALYQADAGEIGRCLDTAIAWERG